MEVVFYKDAKDKEPAKEFLEKLSGEDRAKMVKSIELLAAKGNELRRPQSAALRDKILELRCSGKDNQIRILYFFFVGDMAVLSHGFIKKTDKVPDKEIDTAIANKKDFERRFKNVDNV
ncbi:MAG: type II toxin-antitoxin system RelE/ParE family toxin [Clostridiales bacterium]|nr:type II toxin-antitoxin system RelE/ParE family toxin [Candidatus Crickella equi]